MGSVRDTGCFCHGVYILSSCSLLTCWSAFLHQDSRQWGESVAERKRDLNSEVQRLQGSSALYEDDIFISFAEQHGYKPLERDD